MAREFDIVLLGATGFTGGLTAAELGRRAPQGARIALAGRDARKLDATRARLAPEAPALGAAALITADAADPAVMRDLASRTSVLVTTVGPYILHGREVVAACAAEGTAYADLAGEPEFVDRVYLDHHEQAVASGARLVHCCGFDSIPADLGAHFTAGQFAGDEPLRVRGYVHTEGSSYSGGTYHSALTAFGRARQTLATGRARAGAERAARVDDGRRVHADRPLPHRALGHWALPLPTIDPEVVRRSARALPGYGPDFTYGHYAAVERLPVALVAPVAMIGVFTAAQLPPLRRLMMNRSTSGDGPSAERRARSSFWLRFDAESESGERVLTEAAGGDPGYGETSVMLAESALCLAFDELPELAGQLTTAQAMGAALRTRLERAGITFRVLERR